jgi:hypothetical protein
MELKRGLKHRCPEEQSGHRAGNQIPSAEQALGDSG